MITTPDEFQPLAESLRSDGWCVADQAIEPALVQRLHDECLALDAHDDLTRAGIGHGQAHTLDRRVRGDRTRWLEPAASDPQRRFLAHMQALRVALNRRLLLGMDSFEAHYAVYPPGAFYARHRDCFRDDDARVLSAVLYLNPDWTESDGGALRLYLADGTPHDILPRSGRLVLFLAAEFEHEVLPPRRQRLSIAGWFRRRPPADLPVLSPPFPIAG